MKPFHSDCRITCINPHSPPVVSILQIIQCKSAFAVLFRNSLGSTALPEDDKHEERQMTKQTHDAMRGLRTGRPKQSPDVEQAKALPTSPDREMKETRPSRNPAGERPESLAQFAQSARQQNSDKVPKPLQADEHTAPIPTSNRDKHQVATELLQQGALEVEPDPQEAGVEKLPDRIIDSR